MANSVFTDEEIKQLFGSTDLTEVSPPGEKSGRIPNRDIWLIDHLIKIYKTDDDHFRAILARNKILEYFSGYIGKYISLFAGENVSLRNRDTIRFLSMYLTGRPSIQNALGWAASYIAYSCSNISREDLESELRLIFLKVLDKYKIQDGINAAHVLVLLFRYRVKAWHNRLLRDAMSKTEEVDNLIQSCDRWDGETAPGAIESLFPDPGLPVDEVLTLNSFDLEWIMHPGDRSIYGSLTRHQRLLLHLLYFEGLSVTQIARRLGRSRDDTQRSVDILQRAVTDLLVSTYEGEL